MSKSDPLPASGNGTATSMLPVYRIGDLVWCQEVRNNKLWWPAMITYDPHLGVFYRTTKQKCQQYHVQYFGISAIRGWVSVKSCVPLKSVEEKPFNEKSLSKKVKAEYEVAFQEVAEAAKLDYKQRKLKFIFSFGPSKKGKKSKERQLSKGSSNNTVRVKLEETDSDSVTKSSQHHRENVDSEVEGSSKNKPKPTALIQDPLLKTEGRSRRSSGRSTAKEIAVPQQSGQKSAGSEGIISKTPLLKEGSRRRSRNGQWVAGREKQRNSTATTTSAITSPSTPSVQPPPTLHSQHPDMRATRRRASESSHLSCDQCLQYINKSEGVVELKCTSKPEVFDSSITAASGEPIVMYVQKQYADPRKGNSNKVSTPIPPSLGHNVPTVTPRGKKRPSSSTKNLFHLASHLRDTTTLSGSSSKADSSSPSSSPGLMLNLHLPSNGSVSSESECETGGGSAGEHFLFPASRKRKRTASGASTPIATPLTEVHSKMAKVDEGARKKRKPSNRASSSVLDLEVDSSHPTSSSDREGVGPDEGVKRIRKTNARYSESLNPVAARAKQRTRNNSAAQSVSSIDAACSSANESCSELSTTGLTILTPPCSCSDTEYAPSIDLESDMPLAPPSHLHPTFNRNLGQTSSSRERRKSKQMDSGAASTSEPQLTVCSICDSVDSNLLMCTGHCMSSFHLDCLGLVETPDFKFLCDECLISSGTCFLCGKAHGEVKKCSRPKCSKLYHLECIQDNKLFQIGKGSSFVCPLHNCARCSSIGVSTVNHSNLLQCIKCPLALHKPDCLVAGCEVIDNSRMLCYQHIKITKNTKLYSHINLNTCLECGSIGSLYCCDVCSAAYHLECLDDDSRPGSDTNHWKCPSCAIHDLPTYGSLVITKFGVWRWWPSEVVQPEDIPDNILSKKPGDCMFVVRFCGSRDFCWTYHGRVVPYTEEAELEGMRGHKKPKASDNYKKALEEAREINKTRRKVLEAKEAARQNSKFYTKIKTNKYLVPRPPLDLESLDFLPCQCTPDSPCNDDSTCVNRAIHIECNPKNCPVGELCQNQRMQKCQNAKTEPVFTGNRGWGLKAATDLRVGDFVIEYVGEVLDEAMCRERLKKAHTQNNNNFYMLTLDAGLVIDAGRKSNHARFINHSCGPNCETQKWRVRGEPRIGIFACQNIPAGSELTFDYHLDSLGNEKKKCFCGSKNCSGFLGLRSSKVTSEEDIKTKLKAKKKKKPKPRPSIKNDAAMQQEEEDRHDDDCFICKDGGELLLCDRKSCCRAYHLECINRKVFPSKSKKWDCPWHFCSKCQKPAVAFCSMCPISYCSKHLQDNLSKRQGRDELFCQVCLEVDFTSLKLGDVKPQVCGGEVSGTDSMSTGKWAAASGSASVISQLNAESALLPATTTITKGRLRSPISPDADSEHSLVISRQSSGSLKGTRKSPAGSLKSSCSSRKSPAGSLRSPTGSLRSPTGSIKSPTGSIKSPINSSRVIRSPSIDPAHISTNPERQKSQNAQQQQPTATLSRVVDTHLAALSPPSRVPQPAALLSRTPEAQRQVVSPNAATTVRTSMNRTPLFQPQSPTFGQNCTVPIPEAHSAKLPESYVDFGVQRAAASFQQPQQSPVCNSFINPVWFMPRNGLMNSLDATGAMGASGFHSYPTYPSALLNHSTLGFPYPTGYFGDPLATASATAAAANLESFTHHQHSHASPSLVGGGVPSLGAGGTGGGGIHPHSHQLPVSSSTTPSSQSTTASFQPVNAPTVAAAAAAAAATFQPTSASFSTVFPPNPQNGFLWKYC